LIISHDKYSSENDDNFLEVAKDLEGIAKGQEYAKNQHSSHNTAKITIAGKELRRRKSTRDSAECFKVDAVPTSRNGRPVRGSNRRQRTQKRGLWRLSDHMMHPSISEIGKRRLPTSNANTGSSDDHDDSCSSNILFGTMFNHLRVTPEELSFFSTILPAHR